MTVQRSPPRSSINPVATSLQAMGRAISPNLGASGKKNPSTWAPSGPGSPTGLTSPTVPPGVFVFRLQSPVTSGGWESEDLPASSVASKSSWKLSPLCRGREGKETTAGAFVWPAHGDFAEKYDDRFQICMVAPPTAWAPFRKRRHGAVLPPF